MAFHPLSIRKIKGWSLLITKEKIMYTTLYYFMYCIVITTCNQEDEQRIREALLKERLAACVSSFDIASSYIWREKIENATEKMMFIKTKKEKLNEVVKRIKEIHSYELPEIISIEFDGSIDYLKWIDGVVK